MLIRFLLLLIIKLIITPKNNQIIGVNANIISNLSTQNKNIIDNNAYTQSGWIILPSKGYLTIFCAWQAPCVFPGYVHLSYNISCGYYWFDTFVISQPQFNNFLKNRTYEYDYVHFCNLGKCSKNFQTPIYYKEEMVVVLYNPNFDKVNLSYSVDYYRVNAPMSSSSTIQSCNDAIVKGCTCPYPGSLCEDSTYCTIFNKCVDCNDQPYVGCPCCTDNICVQNATCNACVCINSSHLNNLSILLILLVLVITI